MNRAELVEKFEKLKMLAKEIWDETNKAERKYDGIPYYEYTNAQKEHEGLLEEFNGQLMEIIELAKLPKTHVRLTKEQKE